MTTPQKEDPEHLALRAKPRPVMRLNRRTLMVLVGGLAAVVLLTTLWAFRGPTPRREADAHERHNVERVAQAEGLAALPSDYRQVPMRVSPTTVTEEPAAPASDVQPDPDEEAQAAQQRQQAEAEAAAKAQIFFQKSRESTASSDDAAPTPLAAAPNTMPAAAAPTAGDEQALQNRQAHKQAFVDAESDSRIYASGTLQQPRSPYQLMAGTVIPAALLTAINSDLPGEVIATITEHVYDSVTGRFLLVPQGSRLIGQYDSDIAYGQDRMLLVWSRLIRPDGSSIVLDRLPGVDAMGRAGLHDRLDRHWGQIFAGAALSTLLGVGAELAAPGRTDSEGRVIIATRESLQETVNTMGQEVTRRNLNRQPTLTVRPGFPMRVTVSRDMTLEPVPQ